MLTAEFRPGGIQSVGQTIRRVGCQYVVGQIETLMVDDRLLSNQVEMISRHTERTRFRTGCSKPRTMSIPIL